MRRIVITVREFQRGLGIPLRLGFVLLQRILSEEQIYIRALQDVAAARLLDHRSQRNVHNHEGQVIDLPFIASFHLIQLFQQSLISVIFFGSFSL